jgi:Tol biopolymer transport system component
MLRRLSGVALLACAMALGAHARAAMVYDPEVRYKTLTTPHFLIMFAEGYENIALRAGTIAENTLPYLARRYGWEPAGRTSIIIDDQTDFANGSATIIPSKVITVYVTAPTDVSGLEDYDDWLVTVITHEMTHIIHLDMAYGLPWLARLLFGKYVSMNAYTPTWVTEGVAVYEETVATGSGRGRSSYVDMVIRMACLEDEFPSVDRGYRGYPNWPFSNVAYFIGGRFQLWLAERYGEEALLDYHRTQAADPIPYLTWIPAEIVFDASIESLWSTFEEEMTKDAKATFEIVRTSTPAMTRPRRLTHYGGDLVGPRITPDGSRIVFSASSPVDGIRLRTIKLDGSDDTVLVNETFSKGISFTSDGKAFYFQQTDTNQRFYLHNSLLRYDMKSGDFAKVDVDPVEAIEYFAPSGSLRARDPDVSPDGKRLVFVQAPYGANRLVLAWLESNGTTIHPKVIVPAEPDVELADPRFSPDGRLIALSRFRGGRRDVVLFDLEGKLVEEITRDRAQDVDPTWTKDGRWIVFASDRTGIYNLYAYEIATKQLRQITNLIGGAYQPSMSPDGKTIVYRGYSADGFDVYSIPFEPEKGLLVGDDKRTPVALDVEPRRWPPLRDDLPKIPPPAPFKGTPLPKVLPDGWSMGSYSALDTILPFHDNWNLYPAIYANEREFYGELLHFGSDALGTQHYLLDATYGTRSKFLGGTVGYINDQLEPTFSFVGSAFADIFSRRVFVPQLAGQPCPFGDKPAGPNSSGRTFCYGTENGDYIERRLVGSFGLSLPFLRRHQFSLSYTLEHRAALHNIPAEHVVSLIPKAGRYARVTLGYSYVYPSPGYNSFPYSISLERTWTFFAALSALSKGLGSNYEEYILTTGSNAYVTMPWTVSWLRNHVLATHLVLGISGGPNIENLADTFQLGGNVSVSPLTTTSVSFFGLRGIATGALVGTSIISSTIEYRAPLLRVDHGPGTLPLTLSVFHAALFCDFGRVFEKLDADAIKHGFFGPFAVGVGAELRADVTFTYSLPITGVVGYAYALHTPTNEMQDVAASGPYVRLGSTF